MTDYNTVLGQLNVQSLRLNYKRLNVKDLFLAVVFESAPLKLFKFLVETAVVIFTIALQRCDFSLG